MKRNFKSNIQQFHQYHQSEQSLTFEHKMKRPRHFVGNLGSGLEQSQKCGRLNLNLPTLDKFISNTIQI
jgi:hypothetical protein